MPKSFVGNGRVAVDRCRDIGGDCKDLENPFNEIREVRLRFIKRGNGSVMASMYCEIYLFGGFQGCLGGMV